MSTFGNAEMTNLLKLFAPWVKQLNIQPVDQTDRIVRFLVPENEELVRPGIDGPAIICGQAIAAIADTASVLALSAHNGEFRNCTTVDLNAQFMRPMMLGDVDVTIHTLSNGRRMAVTRAEFQSKGSDKLAATATCTFAYI